MSSPTAMPLPRFGRYELLSLIGRGGMAEVHKARVVSGPGEGSVVALKRLLPELAADADCVDLFTGEADLSRLLRHPHIVEVLEAGEHQDVYYIAMEYVEGRDLGAVLSRCRERHILLPVDFALYLARVLLETLAFVHEARGPTGTPLNVVHGDISPSNVFISKLGEVKLGDFGIARVRALNRWTEGDLVWGKLSYLAPEQISGQPFDHRADLYAAGSLLYELLTNRKPFVAKDAREMRKLIAAQRPRSIVGAREISLGLEKAIFKALEADPDERYQDGRAFAEALEPYFQEQIGTPLAIASVVRGLFGMH